MKISDKGILVSLLVLVIALSVVGQISDDCLSGWVTAEDLRLAHL